MESKNKLNINNLPARYKKSMLQQVMKPRDWASLFVLVAVSAICWIWVLSAYSEPIDIDRIIRNSPSPQTIDKNVLL
jgi:hypothetical protein